MRSRDMHTPHEHTDHDAVMSWLQQREMKDRKLGDARSGRLSAVFVRSTIDRMQECAYLEFPDMDRDTIAQVVREYVDPKAQLKHLV